MTTLRSHSRDHGLDTGGRGRSTIDAVGWLALWFEERVRRNGSRCKKTTIVALARKLLVALWKYVTAGVVTRVSGRDCWDHVLIFGPRHLRQTLTSYSSYYNQSRTHLSLDKDAPLDERSSDAGPFATPILSGLQSSVRADMIFGRDSRSRAIR